MVVSQFQILPVIYRLSMFTKFNDCMIVCFYISSSVHVVCIIIMYKKINKYIYIYIPASSHRPFFTPKLFRLKFLPGQEFQPAGVCFGPNKFC